LKQGIESIEYLADPTSGELRIGGSESFSAGILPPIIHRFCQQYPRVVLHVDDAITYAVEMAALRNALRDRTYDLVLARLPTPLAHDSLPDDLDIEHLFDDGLVVAAGRNSAWSHRRKIDLAELADVTWILTGPNTWGYARIAEAFRARGLDMPKVSLVTFSVHLRTKLLSTGKYVTVFAASILRIRCSIKPDC
jgi:DNA-binding transcriptional LysR family regulator